MKPTDEHPTGDGGADAAGRSKRPKKGPARPSMRRELMELFRDTRAAEAPPAPPAFGPESAPPSLVAASVPESEPAPGAAPLSMESALAAEAEPSRFLRRYLQQSAPTPEPARSGLPSLDDRLGGGFAPGLHVVLGSVTATCTAFLEAVAWEAVGSRRAVLYYPLRSGSLPVWERLIATLSAVLDGRGLDPSALRGRELVPSDVAALTRLDAALQTTVLPYLTLMDHPEDGGGDLSAFISGLRSHAVEAAEQHGRLPLVLIDGLDALLAITGLLPPLQVLARLDEALAGDSLPCLLAADPAGYAEDEEDLFPSRTVLRLRSSSPGPALAAGRVDLEVRKNAVTGWTGVTPLFLDPLSGLFAETRPIE